MEFFNGSLFPLSIHKMTKRTWIYFFKTRMWSLNFFWEEEFSVDGVVLKFVCLPDLIGRFAYRCSSSDLFCQENSLFSKVNFFPPKFPISKIQKKNLAGKNLLCKWTRSDVICLRCAWKGRKSGHSKGRTIRYTFQKLEKGRTNKNTKFHSFFLCSWSDVAIDTHSNFLTCVCGWAAIFLSSK